MTFIGSDASRARELALRILAQNPSLANRQRQLLLHEAEAADRQADMWSDEAGPKACN